MTQTDSVSDAVVAASDASVAGPDGHAAGASLRFDDLFLEHGAAVLRRIESRAPRGADYEGLAQETWVRVMKNLATFRPESEESVRSWILTIAGNLAISAGRGVARRRRLGAEEITGEASERLAEEAWRDLREDPRVDDLRDCRSRLALAHPEFADAVDRHYSRGESYLDISQGIGASVGTVSSRIGRGKAFLKACLEKKQAEDRR